MLRSSDKQCVFKVLESVHVENCRLTVFCFVEFYNCICSVVWIWRLYDLHDGSKWQKESEKVLLLRCQWNVPFWCELWSVCLTYELVDNYPWFFSGVRICGGVWRWCLLKWFYLLSLKRLIRFWHFHDVFAYGFVFFIIRRLLGAVTSRYQLSHVHLLS